MIEIVLHLPNSLEHYREELRLFIEEITSLGSIEVRMVKDYSVETKIVISLVSKTLSDFDKDFYDAYQNRDFRFLFYYFQDISLDIDEIDEDVFTRIAFKEQLSNQPISNEFIEIEDIKATLEIYIKEAIFDIINRTNYSKINPFVTSQSKGDKFYDNDSNLRKVDNFLRRGKRVSLINGLGGVGKTTLAIEYATDALDNEVYDYLIWFDIEKGIDNEIRAFAIKFLLSDTEDGKEALHFYKIVFAKFIQNYPNSLIILDNYTHSPSYQEGLQAFLTQFSHTDIIITSREDISKIAEIKPLKLDVFQNLDDALEMFKRNSKRSYSKNEDDNIKKIIHYLGNLPLALEITANFLDDTDMKIKSYLEALQKEGLKLFDKISDYQPKNHREGLVATLKINTKITDKEETLKLLKAFALLSPEAINKDLIETYIIKELNISDFNKIVSLRELEKFSYIKLSNNNYTMHRLIQESIRDEFFTSNQEEEKEILTQISSAIFDWFVGSLKDNKYGKYFNQSAKHIEYLLEVWKNIISDEAKVYLYTCLSAYVNEITFKPKDILEYIEKAIELEKTIEIENSKKLSIYSQYGRALVLNGRYEDAHTTYDLALGFTEEDSIYMADIYAKIGFVYNSQKKYKEALEYYQKDLNISLQMIGKNHPDTATTYGNIGSVYDSQEKYKEALEYYQKSLDIQLQTIGKNHPDTAISYNNIGLVYDSQKRYKEALDYYEKSLDIKLQTIGVNHPDTAITYRNIGLIHKDLRECKKAKECLQKALNIMLSLDINMYILDLKRTIKEIDKNIQKEKKLQHNKKGRYCKDA
jgi:tetratricopeptide (TPR) repeat protein